MNIFNFHNILNSRLFNFTLSNNKYTSTTFLIINSFFISYLLYKYFFNNTLTIKKVDKLIKEEKYQDKYKEELNNFISTNKLSEKFLKNLINNIEEDELPNGLVKMFYNHESESFWYFCDNKNSKYEDLAALSRKYVISFNCKELYVNRQEEFKKARIKLKEKKEEEKKKEEKKKKESENEEENDKPSVFAKLKTYNVRPGGAKNMEDNYIVCEKSNRYSYRGTLEDYDTFVNKKKETKNNIKREFNYKDFKKMINSVQEEEGNKKQENKKQENKDDNKSNNEMLNQSWIDVDSKKATPVAEA